MGIQDKNDIIFLAYDSIVEYGATDYTVISRSNISNPVISYLLYELSHKSGVRYLWYDKKEHKLALLELCDRQAINKDQYQTLLSDNFHRQLEKKQGAPALYPVSLNIMHAKDKKRLLIIEKIDETENFYEGPFVSTSELNIYPYSE